MGVAQKHNTYADQLKKKIAMLEAQIQKDLKSDASPSKTKLKKKRQSVVKNVGKDLKAAKTELKDRNDQITLLHDMLRSSMHENQMKDKDLERLEKKLRTFQGNPSGFKSLGKLKNIDKQNRTENTFLPASLRGAVKAEASFPYSTKSGKDSYSNHGAFPNVRGANQYDDKYSQGYEDISLRSNSQVSLAISQKRGDKIIAQNRKKLEQLKETPRMYNETRVTSIEPVKGDDNMFNLKIQEEDASLEEGTMQFKPPQPDFIDPRELDDPDFEEGDSDDYNLNEI